MYIFTFVVHGGISADFDLDLLKTLNRSSYPNVDGTDSLKLCERDPKEKQLLQDILWSDPQVDTFDLSIYSILYSITSKIFLIIL